MYRDMKNTWALKLALTENGIKSHLKNNKMTLAYCILFTPLYSIYNTELKLASQSSPIFASIQVESSFEA